MTAATVPPDTDYRNWPLYWFARLEAALEAGDLSEAADAQRRLDQLGLRVKPHAPWADGGGASLTANDILSPPAPEFPAARTNDRGEAPHA